MIPAHIPLLFGGKIRPAVFTDFSGGVLSPSNYTYSGASLKTVTDATGAITYAPNNLLLNSATLSTQNVTTNGYSSYLINFTGAGSITLSGTATGTVTGGAGYLKITPTGGALTLTVSGSVTNAVMAAVTYETAPRPGDQVITTSAAYYGPAFDYAAGQWAGLWNGYALRVEESRTNLAIYSSTTNTGWSSNAGDTVTYNATTAPDSTVSATKVALSTGFTTNRYLNNNTVSAGNSYTVSFFLKAGSGSQYQAVIMYGSSGSYRFWVNTTTGATSGATLGGTWTGGSVVTPVNAGNGWWRVSATATVITDTSITIETDQSSVSGGYTTIAGDYFYIWGAQLEQGPFPTSYIPTGAASAARAADQYLASGALASCLGGSRGSLIIKTTNGQAGTAATLMSANGIVMLGETVANKLTTALTAGLTSSNTATWTGANTSGLSWGPGKGVIALNGTYTSDANTRTPAASFYLGSTGGSSAFFNGHFSSLTAYTSQLAKPQ